MDRSDPNPQQRVQCAALDSMLFKKINVLDKGFISILDYMGTDKSIVEAARISYGKNDATSDERNFKLIKYLMKHDHTSPFEMNEIKLHVKAPLFVARQWLRHRTANVNEYSARYSEMKDEFYIPSLDQIRSQSTNNKQGRSDLQLQPQIADFILEEFKNMTETSYDCYLECLDRNLTRELARCNLTTNIYTQFIWKIDLHNLLHFLRLRLDETAQYEIRVYAKEILNIVKLWVPFTYRAFVEYKLESYRVSKSGLVFIKNILSNYNIQLPTYESLNKPESILSPSPSISKNEYDEIAGKFFSIV